VKRSRHALSSDDPCFVRHVRMKGGLQRERYKEEEDIWVLGGRGEPERRREWTPTVWCVGRAISRARTTRPDRGCCTAVGGGRRGDHVDVEGTARAKSRGKLKRRKWLDLVRENGRDNCRSQEITQGGGVQD